MVMHSNRRATSARQHDIYYRTKDGKDVGAVWRRVPSDCAMMLATLLAILSWDAPTAEIILGDDGKICLDWYGGDVGATIAPSGSLAWAFSRGDEKKHGTDLDGLRKVLAGS